MRKNFYGSIASCILLKRNNQSPARLDLKDLVRLSNLNTIYFEFVGFNLHWSFKAILGKRQNPWAEFRELWNRLLAQQIV